MSKTAKQFFKETWEETKEFGIIAFMMHIVIAFWCMLIFGFISGVLVAEFVTKCNL